MPRSAPTPCRHPACSLVLETPGYCDQHRAAAARDYGRARRGFDVEVGFYSSTRWRAVRAACCASTRCAWLVRAMGI
jgi:5-methylcytosine-specific restriction protein A